MTAIITDRKTKAQSIIAHVTSAVTHYDYIAIHFVDEDGRKDCDVFTYRDAEVQLIAEP